MAAPSVSTVGASCSWRSLHSSAPAERGGTVRPWTTVAPTVLVSVAGGVPTGGWSSELGFLALVAGLRRRSLPVPARVVGLWPEAGEHRILDVDGRALHAAADRVLAAVGTVSGLDRPGGADGDTTAVAGPAVAGTAGAGTAGAGTAGAGTAGAGTAG